MIVTLHRIRDRPQGNYWYRRNTCISSTLRPSQQWSSWINWSKRIYCKQALWNGIQLRWRGAERPPVPPEERTGADNGLINSLSVAVPRTYSPCSWSTLTLAALGPASKPLVSVLVHLPIHGGRRALLLWGTSESLGNMNRRRASWMFGKALASLKQRRRQQQH